VVLKTGRSERERGEYCLELGGDICPHVYGFVEDGYIMETLQRADRDDQRLLIAMERALHRHVWFLPGAEKDWLTPLRQRIECPAPPDHGPARRTHGDSTVSNAMRRGDRTLVIIDPLPPRPHVAECPEADMGRLLQSALGWEVLMYGDEDMLWDPPEFWFDDQLRRAALWWCGATARRIMIGETRPVVLAWCVAVAERCFDEYRV